MTNNGSQKYPRARPSALFRAGSSPARNHSDAAVTYIAIAATLSQRFAFISGQIDHLFELLMDATTCSLSHPDKGVHGLLRCEDLGLDRLPGPKTQPPARQLRSARPSGLPP